MLLHVLVLALSNNPVCGPCQVNTHVLVNITVKYRTVYMPLPTTTTSILTSCIVTWSCSAFALIPR